MPLRGPITFTYQSRVHVAPRQKMALHSVAPPLKKADATPVLLRILVLSALLWSRHANALEPTHTHVTMPDGTTETPEMRTPPELENRPRSDFEKSLMSELACTCGTCDLEPIDTCRCEFAAKMRGELLDELDKQDLSTEATRHRAAESARTSFVERYGTKVRRHRPNLDAAVGGFGAVAIAALAGALGIRAYRRRRAADTE